jgi:hypothetical protein
LKGLCYRRRQDLHIYINEDRKMKTEGSVVAALLMAIGQSLLLPHRHYTTLSQGLPSTAAAEFCMPCARDFKRIV